MATAPKLTKAKHGLFVDDGQNRGPLAMVRLRFHPAGRLLLAQCVDRRLALWAVDAEPQKLADKHKDKGECVVGSLVCPHDAGWIRGFDIHPQGTAVATLGSDRRLRLWKWEGDAIAATPAADVAAHDGWGEAVGFSPDGSRIATLGADRRLKLWNAATLQPIAAVEAHTACPRDLAWTRDGRQIVTGGEDGSVILWKADGLTAESTIAFGRNNTWQGQEPPVSGVLRVAISRDDRWIGVGGFKLAQLYERSSGHPVCCVKDAQVDLAFSPQHDLFVCGEHPLRLWAYDAAAFKAVSPETGPDGKPKPVEVPPIPGAEAAANPRGERALGSCFSPDGRRLALGKGTGVVELWEVETA